MPIGYKHPVNGALEPSIVKGRVLTSVYLLQPQVEHLAHWTFKYKDQLHYYREKESKHSCDVLRHWSL